MENNTKEIYYNKKTYLVPLNSVKFLNGVDVALLPNNLLVYWDDASSNWLVADKSLEELYFDIDLIKLKRGENEVETHRLDKSNIINIAGKKVACLILKKYISCDISEKSENDCWSELEDCDELVRIYKLLEKNKLDLTYFEKNNIL